MARRDPAIALRQMLEHAVEALRMMGGKTREDLGEDRMLNLAVVRLLEILGEAAGRVPPEVRRKHTDIPWNQLVGMRNRLIHAYDFVDLDIVWQILTTDLPDLVKQLESVVQGDKGEGR